MKSHLAAVLFAAAMTAAFPVAGQEKVADVNDMQTLRNAVRVDKKAYVASVLALSDTEAKRFWPLYDAYQRDIDLANRRRNVALEVLIASDKPFSDLYARSLANELIAADEAELKSRRSLHNRLMRGLPTRILPPKKAARYLQLESKIRAVQAYDVASAIPLIH
jgi:hypothetical protein